MACALVYAIVIIKNALSDREALRLVPGDLRKIMPAELLVYFLATIGISDFVMNTIVVKQMKLAEADALPDTLITAGIVPGSVIGVMYLMNAGYVDPILIIIMLAGLMIGSYVGAKLVGRMEGSTIRKVMITLLILLLIVLIVKNRLSGEPGDLTSLGGWKLIFLIIVTLALGVINMMGIPTKPFFTTIFLILGLSPITTLALLLGTIPIAVITGGVDILKRKRYNKKVALSAVTAGSIGGVIGCSLAITIDQNILNIILIIVIITAIISLVRR